MTININLLLGKLDMKDIMRYVNPDEVEGFTFSEKIPHYPIMNSKLNVLVGEEAKRPFDYRVVVTNPTAISEKEKVLKNEILGALEALLTQGQLSEEELQKKTEELQKYYRYEWQDLREIRAN